LKPSYLHNFPVRNTIFGFLLLCAFLSCSKHEIIKRTDQSGHYIEQFQVDKRTGKKDGYYQKYLDTQLIELAHYISDTLNGKRKLFFESGNIEIVEDYRSGRFHGTYKRYLESGQLKIIGKYVSGEMEGIWKSFYPNGIISELVFFRGSEENGPFIEYHESGKIKAEGMYRNGDYEHGVLKLYDRKGDLERLMYCKNGICRTQWSYHAD
jgi:antitoxin component YwqK of YwqJK toxin-antitoxin module